MISRKTALEAGRYLNSMVDEGPYTANAIRIANEIMFQYYLIPRSIREEFYRKEPAADGVLMQDLSEE